MKKVISLVFIVAFLTILIGFLNVIKSPTFKVILKDEQSNSISYKNIYSRKLSWKTDEFLSDDLVIYTAKPDTFISFIKNNKVLNRLNNIELENIDINSLSDKEILASIFLEAEKIEHEIWEFKILKSDGRYFVLIKLNVNWQSPNDLYEYDLIENDLMFLHTLKSKDIVGISFK